MGERIIFSNIEHLSEAKLAELDPLRDWQDLIHLGVPRFFGTTFQALFDRTLAACDIIGCAPDSSLALAVSEMARTDELQLQQIGDKYLIYRGSRFT